MAQIAQLAVGVATNNEPAGLFALARCVIRALFWLGLLPRGKKLDKQQAAGGVLGFAQSAGKAIKISFSQWGYGPRI